MRNRMKIAPVYFLGLPLFSLLASAPAHAHCPLCTAGAGVAALGAAKLGMSPMSIGIFLGAFAVALGLWFGRLLKKQYLPKQTALLAIFSFATTIFPLQAVLADNTSLYLPFWSEYGKTFVINLFVIGSVAGGALIILAPYLSSKLTLTRGGEVYPFQGMAITLALLVSGAAVIELVL
jgi:hypothetical protein